MKRKTTFGDVVRWIAMAVCVIVMLCCGVYLVSLGVESYRNKQAALAVSARYVSENQGFSDQVSNWEVEGEEAVNEPPAYTVDFEGLKSVSPYVVGWIQVSGIEVIDYPVVQYSNDSFYLTHSWDGADNRYGAIFLESTNSADFNDSYTLIYGHYMKNGTMFGSLQEYADEAFFAEHGGVITLYLPGETRTYQVFSVEYVVADDAGVYTLGFAPDDQFEEFLVNMKARSLYDTGVEVSAEDRVITLSTCAGSGSSQRLVLHAKLVSTYPLS